MNIPPFANIKYTDEDGYLTPQIQMYSDQLNNVLRAGLSDNGWTVASQTQAQITEIEAFTGLQAKPDGTMWYDSTNEVMVFKLGGALFTFTPVAWP